MRGRDPWYDYSQDPADPPGHWEREMEYDGSVRHYWVWDDEDDDECVVIEEEEEEVYAE